jgi:hypothetical protein
MHLPSLHPTLPASLPPFQALRATRLFKRSDDGSRAFALGVVDTEHGSNAWAGNQAYCQWVEEASEEMQSYVLARQAIQASPSFNIPLLFFLPGPTTS